MELMSECRGISSGAPMAADGARNAQRRDCHLGPCWVARVWQQWFVEMGARACVGARAAALIVDLLVRREDFLQQSERHCNPP